MTPTGAQNSFPKQPLTSTSSLPSSSVIIPSNKSKLLVCRDFLELTCYYYAEIEQESEKTLHSNMDLGTKLNEIFAAPSSGTATPAQVLHLHQNAHPANINTNQLANQLTSHLNASTTNQPNSAVLDSTSRSRQGSYGPEENLLSSIKQTVQTTSSVVTISATTATLTQAASVTTTVVSAEMPQVATSSKSTSVQPASATTPVTQVPSSQRGQSVAPSKPTVSEQTATSTATTTSSIPASSTGTVSTVPPTTTVPTSTASLEQSLASIIAPTKAKSVPPTTVTSVSLAPPSNLDIQPPSEGTRRLSRFCVTPVAEGSLPGSSSNTPNDPAVDSPTDAKPLTGIAPAVECPSAEASTPSSPVHSRLDPPIPQCQPRRHSRFIVTPCEVFPTEQNITSEPPSAVDGNSTSINLKDSCSQTSPLLPKVCHS